MKKRVLYVIARIISAPAYIVGVAVTLVGESLSEGFEAGQRAGYRAWHRKAFKDEEDQYDKPLRQTDSIA